MIITVHTFTIARKIRECGDRLEDADQNITSKFLFIKCSIFKNTFSILNPDTVRSTDLHKSI